MKAFSVSYICRRVIVHSLSHSRASIRIAAPGAIDCDTVAQEDSAVHAVQPQLEARGILFRESPALATMVLFFLLHTIYYSSISRRNAIDSPVCFQTLLCELHSDSSIYTAGGNRNSPNPACRNATPAYNEVGVSKCLL
jgi:hypothetical protein